ncbi:MAG: zinc ABC transporter solute-binding protein [Okeania sp. SIO2G4]|uniref:metal ABC transporter substrate-binding protein n=1 Tax=unclassified Okeania TaxID=2634635 RepID=UPI0013B9F297|nr:MULTISPECIES: zinc ABC transporter substrate-binding protein [unclassified Okeania]NEP40566.1 zinc ABC transporter solute-binding protein [Okeania sp. SIO2H7]NEP71831.1 zinc ABC transporter solute-binding protein [Okeania sp. SIO2G5]NEP92851.1 zinc ABC transporter solute-binding protein [Okeania sp. SIO2F5]NEQ90928.1 zinc ABC transporter solute-binding protein [Okeania sp. SIO2G4]
MLKTIRRIHCLFLGTAALATAVSLGSVSSVAQNQNETKIVATFLPIYMFTKGVTGESGKVELLIPAGADPHDYQATPENARSIAEADVLVKNGLGLEEFLEKLVDATGNSQLQEIDASQNIEPLEEEDKDHEDHEDHDHDHHNHDHDHGHHHEEGNPHVWLDPVLAQQQVKNIRDGLIQADSNNEATYRANADIYLRKLQELHQEFQTRLSPFQGCKFIAFHDAYPYLAQRYNLQQMAVVELPEDNITPRDVQRVIKAAQEYQVKGLLAEVGFNDNRMQQIAKDVKLPIKKLDPINSGSLDSEHYFTAMRNNLKTLEEVCQ